MVVEIEGVKCRALLDTGAGTSYVSSKIIDLVNKKPIRNETKTIQTLMSSSNQKIPVYSVNISDAKNQFTFKANLHKLEKRVLLELPNPKYSELQNKYQHLKDIEINDTDMKPVLPVHIVLGVNEYARLKTQERPRIGLEGEPIAELTKLGWVVLSPGDDFDLTNLLFSKTSLHDYENLCSLDCLGIEEKHSKPDDLVYEKFRKQLHRSPEGFYETGLIWKEDHPHLNNNKSGSLGRLNNLVKSLKQTKKLEVYDSIMQEFKANQFIEKINVEEVNETVSEKVFYLPHRPVIREHAETTKVRIVFDASTKANQNSVSLNECLETGPPLQNSLWDILIRTRMRPILLSGDIEKAFYQIRIREFERDVLRFHWISALDVNIIEINRFTRLIMGLTQSLFVLEGTLKEHFNNYRFEYQKLIEKIKDDMYVDDLMTGGNNISEVKEIKNQSIDLFAKGGFKLHKWHSNISSLENNSSENNNELTYAKQLFNNQQNCTKILGLVWDKKKDQISANVPKYQNKLVTKRNILSYIASIYDPLGFSQSCHRKINLP